MTKKREKLFWLIAILLVTIIAYLPAFNNGFTNWDDGKYITKNPFIQELSWQNIKIYFSEIYFGIYHPLTLLSLSIDFQVAEFNPWIYHFNNIILHLINTALVYWFILLLIRRLDMAIIIAALFGVHTLHVESVAWVATRKDVLYTMFFMASLVLYLKYLKINHVSNTGLKVQKIFSSKFYILSLFLFLFSLMSKGLAVSLSVTLIAIDYLHERKILSRQVIFEKIPFFILSIVFGIISIIAPSSAGTFADVALYNFYERFLLICYGFGQYLFKLVYPFKLVTFYPYPFKPDEHIPWEFWLYPILILGLILTFIYAFKKNRQVTFGFIFFVVNIFLVLQFLPIGGYVMADRYTYIPSIGFYFILALGFIKLIHLIQINKLSIKSTKSLTFGLKTLLFGYIILLSVLTFNRCKVWNNSISLWDDVLSKHPNTARAWINRGDANNDMKNYSEAIKDFDNAIRIEPYFFSVSYLNRGRAKGNIGDYSSALEDFNKSIQLDPNDPQAYFNRGLTFGILGKKLIAISDFSKAIELDPYFSIAYFYRGLARVETGSKNLGCPDLMKANYLGYKDAPAQLQKYCK